MNTNFNFNDIIDFDTLGAIVYGVYRDRDINTLRNNIEGFRNAYVTFAHSRFAEATLKTLDTLSTCEDFAEIKLNILELFVIGSIADAPSVVGEAFAEKFCEDYDEKEIKLMALMLIKATE